MLDYCRDKTKAFFPREFRFLENKRNLVLQYLFPLLLSIFRTLAFSWICYHPANFCAAWVGQSLKLLQVLFAWIWWATSKEGCFKRNVQMAECRQVRTRYPLYSERFKSYVDTGRETNLKNLKPKVWNFDVGPTLFLFGLLWLRES